MTNIATLAVAMVGSVITVSWLTWRLVRGVPDGYDSETEVKTPLVTIRRKVQRSERWNNAGALQEGIDNETHGILDTFSDTDKPGSDTFFEPQGNLKPQGILSRKAD